VTAERHGRQAGRFTGGFTGSVMFLAHICRVAAGQGNASH
jgi:hypothetical protein